MPFKSEKQRRFMWAQHPEIAKRWTKEYGAKPMGAKKYPAVGLGDLAQARLRKRAGTTVQNGGGSPLNSPPPTGSQRQRVPVQGGSNVNLKTGKVSAGPNSREAARAALLKKLAKQRKK